MVYPIMKTFRIPLPKHAEFSLPPQIVLDELVVLWGVPETSLMLTDSLRTHRPQYVVMVVTVTYYRTSVQGSVNKGDRHPGEVPGHRCQLQGSFLQ